MGRIPLAATACAVGLLIAGPALAAAPPNTGYGGGHVADQPSGKQVTGRAGDVLVTVLSSADGNSLRIGATVLHACGSAGTIQAFGLGNAPVAPDGTFTTQTKETIRVGRRSIVHNMTISGKVDGPRVTGTIASTSSFGGQQVCRGTSGFETVVPGAVGPAPAPPPAGQVLKGILDAEALSPFQIVLRVAPDAKSVTRVIFVTPLNCRRDTVEIYYERGTVIQPDGSFRISNPYRTRFADGVERGRVIVEGKFMQGGAVGTVQTTSTFRNRRGRVRDRCRSGKRAWRAIV